VPGGAASGNSIAVVDTTAVTTGRGAAWKTSRSWRFRAADDSDVTRAGPVCATVESWNQNCMNYGGRNCVLFFLALAAVLTRACFVFPVTVTFPLELDSAFDAPTFPLTQYEDSSFRPSRLLHAFGITRQRVRVVFDAH